MVATRFPLLSSSLLVLMISACGGDSNEKNPYTDYVTENYSGVTNWICHPGVADAENPCLSEVDATIVQADGTANIESVEAAVDPKVDCFYVYPTVSFDDANQSDFIPGDMEISTIRLEAARYKSVCRMYAPSYRQLTLRGLNLNGLTQEQKNAIFDLAYVDVLDAFREYMRSENKGRGVILVGHSQGSIMLRRLVAEEFENDDYLMRRLISAHLIGINIEVPRNADVGGLFRKTPACRATDQTGCVISYVTFRKDDPALASGVFFGNTGDPDTTALCVHPGALTGGSAPLNVRLPMPDAVQSIFKLITLPRGSDGPYADQNTNLALTTDFFGVPGQVSGRCVLDANGTGYLEVTISSDASDPRADDYPAEFSGGAGWGMHLQDMPLAMADLVNLASLQSAAWLEKRGL